MRILPYISSATIFTLTVLAVNLPFTSGCPPVPLDQQADLYFNKGIALFFNDSLSAAETALRASIAYQPYFARAHFYLAEVYVRQAEFEDALTEYKKTIELDQECYQALYRLALLMATLDQYDQAIQILQRAVTVHPYYKEAYTKLAALYIETGDFRSAEQVYEIIERLDDR
jgi:tetratricopeptide (TPR) repeat protein